MRLVAGCDPFRVWIADADTGLDDPDHIRAQFHVYTTGANGMPKRLHKRLMRVAGVMAEAANRELGTPEEENDG